MWCRRHSTNTSDRSHGQFVDQRDPGRREEEQGAVAADRQDERGDQRSDRGRQGSGDAEDAHVLDAVRLPVGDDGDDQGDVDRAEDGRAQQERLRADEDLGEERCDCDRDEADCERRGPQYT